MPTTPHLPEESDMSDVIIIEGRFACTGCVPAEVRDALSATTADRHDIVRSSRPYTACCDTRVRYSSENGVYVNA